MEEFYKLESTVMVKQYVDWYKLPFRRPKFHVRITCLGVVSESATCRRDRITNPVCDLEYVAIKEGEEILKMKLTIDLTNLFGQN